MFFVFAPLVLASHLLVAATGSPPSIDIQRSCRESSGALYGSSTGDVVASCVEDEKNASAELAKNWATFPAADKVLCVHAAIYLPSYVEWLTCIEGEIALRRIRKDSAAPRG